MSSLANRLINVSEVARRNGFHVYEFEANLELAKFWILSGQSQLVIGHLNEIDYLARFAADHYTLKIIGLYQIAAHIIKVWKISSLSSFIEINFSQKIIKLSYNNGTMS